MKYKLVNIPETSERCEHFELYKEEIDIDGRAFWDLVATSTNRHIVDFLKTLNISEAGAVC
jgi:hypothetical protein